MKEVRMDYDLFLLEKEKSEIEGYEVGYNDAIQACDRYMVKNHSNIRAGKEWKKFLETVGTQLEDINEETI